MGALNPGETYVGQEFQLVVGTGRVGRRSAMRATTLTTVAGGDVAQWTIDAIAHATAQTAAFVVFAHEAILRDANRREPVRHVHCRA